MRLDLGHKNRPVDPSTHIFSGEKKCANYAKLDFTVNIIILGLIHRFCAKLFPMILFTRT